MTTSLRLASGTALLLVTMGVYALAAQETPAPPVQPDGVTKGPATVEKPDPLKRPLSDKEKFAQRRSSSTGESFGNGILAAGRQPRACARFYAGVAATSATLRPSTAAICRTCTISASN